MSSFDLNTFVIRHMDTRNLESDEKVVYSPDELHELCQRSIDVFSTEPNLVRIVRPCNVIGSLYGSFGDLLDTFDTVASETRANVYGDKYVFLGNYVDYGSRSIETISLLLALKIDDPAKYFLLRGNHECAIVKDGFYDELVGRFGADEGEKLFNHFNEVFSWMPLAGLIDENVFCVHGGPSPLISSFKDIEKIPRPLHDPLSNPLAIDLLWGEPYEKAVYYLPNPARHNAKRFGKDMAAKFCCDFQLQMILRGSDVSLNGGWERFCIARRRTFEATFVISLFGASDFAGEYKAGCILSVVLNFFNPYTRSIV